MKRILIILALQIPGMVCAEECDSRVQSAYIQVHDLYGMSLNPPEQFALQDILRELCQERPPVVVKEDGKTRYRTASPRRSGDRAISTDVIPAWVEIDWYRGITDEPEPRRD